MAPESFILDLNPEKSQFVPDLASVVKIDPNNPGAMLFLQGATLPVGKCLPAGLPGYKIVVEQPKIATCPMVVRLDGEEDFIVLAFKNNGPNFYLYGLSAPALLAWKAPAKGDESEESILRLMNLSHAKLIGAVELENTETCALKDKVEELLRYLPSFNKQTPKIVTCQGMNKWCDRTFSENIKTVTRMGELSDRRTSARKGEAAGGSGGKELSAAGGADASSKWADLLKLLKQVAHYYDQDFGDRFLLLMSDADIEQARTFLQGHPFEGELLMGLANFENVKDKLSSIVNHNTPWADLSQAQSPPTEAGAEGAGGEGAGRNRRTGPMFSKAATRGAAAAKDAVARGAAAAEAAKAKPPDTASDPPAGSRAKSAARPPRVSSKTPAGEEADGAPPKKKPPAAAGGGRMTASAASALHTELAELRARVENDAKVMAKMVKDHAAELAKEKDKAAEWKTKHDNLEGKRTLELQLKEAQVKNSMMAVAWQAHTSALSWGASARASGGAGGSGSPAMGTPPPNPFAGFV